MKDSEQKIVDWTADESLDAVEAAPQSHFILYENEEIRVVKVTVAPAHKEPIHTHRWPSVMIVQSSVRIRYFDADGSSTDFPKKVISSQKPFFEFLEPEGPHAIENIDAAPYQAIRIEIKTK